MTTARPLKPLLLFLTAGLLMGWLADDPWLGLSVASLILLMWYHQQQQRLLRWLKADDGTEVPEARGSWEDLYDALYHRLRRHRQVEENLKSVIERIQQSAQAIRDGVVMIDSAGEIEWWNRAGSRLLGLKRPDDIGQPLTNLIRDPRFVRYFERRQYQEPLELPASAERQRQLQFTITEFGQDERLLLVRDVSRLHQLERMRRDFIANASHELRTPLTVIRGYLETLQDQCSEQPLMRRALGQMDTQARRMGNLVNDMLMLNRLETSESLRDEFPIDIGRILREIHAEANVLAQERLQQITLEIDERYRLLGQEQELYSAFANLVFNAVKYTPDQGLIEVIWTVSADGGRLHVRDTGIGIEPQHIERLTERFYRVDDGRSRSMGGTGLGLAIVKHVLLRHGARLKISSIPGKGSTFSCLFPPATLYEKEKAIPPNDAV